MRNGRFEIPDSMFFSNANDLSLQLIIAVTQFMYLLYQSQIWKRVLGAGAMLAALVFMFQTAARGAFLAILVVACVGFLFGKSRVRLLVAALPVTLIALWLVPGSIFHRLTLITVSLDSADISDSQDESAVASQIQRIDLLRQSVTYALTHPIFGVGPDEFAVAVYGDSVKNGTRAPWLGTHNSYTQVASECGLPALVLYCGVIFISLRSNFRIYRRAAKYPELSDLSALAFCLFNSTLVYAICTFFFHIAYSSYLPGIAGMSIALRLATDPSLWARRAAPSVRAMAPVR
jgi:O-antigen ligase